MSDTQSEIADPGDQLRLKFDAGTIVVSGMRPDSPPILPQLQFDPRIGAHRIEAIWYRILVETLLQAKLPFVDDARAYGKTPWKMRLTKTPFPHQSESLEAWWTAGGRGIVVLPTGTGKTHVANLCIERAERPALVVTPTIDLMNQWYDELILAFGQDVGLLGGGYHEILPLTVTTYDSACIHMDHIGNRFGLIVFDECHHLPGPTYGLAATMSLAPFRLGLTATPERADEGHMQLASLVGPMVFRREITQLRGQYLADYRVEKLLVELSDEDRHRYEKARETYRQFLRACGINLSRQGGWGQFLMMASRSTEGRRAFAAYQEQRSLAMAAPAKLDLLRRLLDFHVADRVLIFTNDNATVYEIARRYLVPVITHETKTKERRDILLRFNSGHYPVVATSRVLNEGVNVPEANVAIVLSGTGSVREHVQRLGRILRKSGDKEALLYEVVSRGTVEEFTSTRRRRHSAYGDDP